MKNQFHHENLSRQVQIAGQMSGGHRRNILESDADVSRLRKGLSLPSRRLVPCILAALTAGTVTLGALPCADAAPIVRSAVTEDIDAPEGVAGSIDGSDATITVGTEGGGTSPRIKRNSSSYGAVNGSYYYGASPFTQQGGSAVIRSGTMQQVYGSKVHVKAEGAYETAYTQVTGGSVTITGGETSRVVGGSAYARTDRGSAEVTARGNVVRLQGGTHVNVYGGQAESPAHWPTIIAEDNTVYISGGTYRPGGLIAGGKAAGSGTNTARNNTIEITGAPGPLPKLFGGISAGGGTPTLENNALIVRDTKGITAVSAEHFQKFVFYVPAGLAANQPMLSLISATQDVKLEGALVEAHLPGSVTAHDLTLLQTAAHITTDAATKMTVYEGISGGILTSTIYVDNTKQKLMVRRDGSFLFTGVDNAKSLAETMAGAAAFLGTGAHLFTGPGISSASIEAAAASGFAPFAAVGGSSLRHETGSHVNVRGMNLAVGFSREVMRGDNRILFGPIVEYGRGSYDSYLDDGTHGEGNTHYVGGGVFLKQEKKDGIFYEGSLRLGRMSTDYEADLPVGGITRRASYDTDANYVGAHLGLGHTAKAANGTERELYLRYFYTHQNGASATLSTGDRYDFHAVDSHRLRTGARWTIPKGSGALILGTSLQYEFKGDAGATYHTGGFSYDTPSPSLKGLSASLELGWKAPLSKNATADLSVEGWAGKQRGVTFKAGFDWRF